MPKLGSLWESAFFLPWVAGALLALMAAVYLVLRKDFRLANSMRALARAAGLCPTTRPVRATSNRGYERNRDRHQ